MQWTCPVQVGYNDIFGTAEGQDRASEKYFHWNLKRQQNAVEGYIGGL